MAHAARNQIGPYQLLRLLRTGQTSQVWVALGGAGTERYALKVLKEDFRKDRSQVAQMKHEFAVGRELEHPRVIRCFDFDIDGQIPYLVLELFGSRNIKQVLNEGINQIAVQASSIIKQSADGLAYFHEQGWVHRDVKLDNYLLDDNWNVKLIDFSLAVKIKTRLTRLIPSRAKVQGTRSYMSPEQIRGEPLDERADIYSFGCMLYEMIGGRPPYTAESADDLLHKHLRANVPTVLSLQANVTEEFAELLQIMMAKNINKRIPNMNDFRKEFSRIRIYRKPPQPTPQ